jgi:hypothetical protein
MIIQLTQGHQTMIDDIDADLNEYDWHTYVRMRKTTPTALYARRNTKMADGERKYRSAFFMHRVILERVIGRPLIPIEQVDHINHNGLDNRRENLRLSDASRNNHNQQIRSGGKSSKYKGVSWYAPSAKWASHIKVNGKQKHLGHFENEEDAARAYDANAMLFFGSCSCLNFPAEIFGEGKA